MEIKSKYLINPDKGQLYDNAVNKFFNDRQPQAIYPMADVLRMDTSVVEIDEKTLARLTETITAKMIEDAAKKDKSDELLKAQLEKEKKERTTEVAEITLEVLRTMIPNLGLPAFNQIKTLGYTPEDGPMDGYNEWLLTGDKNDDIADEKAAWQEGTDSEGGYAVPTGMASIIHEKLDETSIARIMGAEVIDVTEGFVFEVPVEDTRLTDWVITAEEGAVDQDEGDLAQLSMTIYNFTKLHKVSNELLADARPNLVKYFGSRWGRSWGLTENEYFLVGTGSGQPQGAVVGGTAGVVLASTSTLTAAELITLYYNLPKPYRAKSSFVTKDSTEKIIRGLTGNPFLFANTPQGREGPTGLEDILTRPAFTSDSMAAFTNDAKVALHGSWEHYSIAQRQGIVVVRDESIYRGNSQTGFFANVRVGAGVAVAEAFYYAAAAA